MSLLQTCRKFVRFWDLCNFVKLKPSTIRVAYLLRNGHDCSIKAITVCFCKVDPNWRCTACKTNWALETSGVIDTDRLHSEERIRWGSAGQQTSSQVQVHLFYKRAASLFLVPETHREIWTQQQQPQTTGVITQTEQRHKNRLQEEEEKKTNLALDNNVFQHWINTVCSKIVCVWFSYYKNNADIQTDTRVFH